jgi:hypothetical protein
MTADYKQLAKELYETLNEVSRYLPIDRRFPSLNNALQKYEEATTRCTGRTTTLYHKAIAESLANPGKSIEFVDHYPHNWCRAEMHTKSLERIINKLGYDIVVSTTGQARVYLYNRFGQ